MEKVETVMVCDIFDNPLMSNIKCGVGTVGAGAVLYRVATKAPQYCLKRTKPKSS
jgi:hypothetical protein